MMKPISHGLRIWAFHFQAAIPLVLFALGAFLTYIAVFRIAGLPLMPHETLYQRWVDFSVFANQPLWVKLEAGVCLFVAVICFFVSIVEMIAYTFFNLANPLKIMPRISKNLGHFYQDVKSNKESHSKMLFLKNSLSYGLAFAAFLLPCFWVLFILYHLNLSGTPLDPKTLMIDFSISMRLVSLVTGLFLILDFLYILFMEIHPKQKTIFEVFFKFRKVSGRQ